MAHEGHIESRGFGERQSLIEQQALFDGSDTRTRLAVLDSLLQVCGAEELRFLQGVLARRTPLSPGTSQRR